MFKSTTVIMRENTDNDFFYIYDATLSKIEYLNLIEKYKNLNKFISENLHINEDNLMLERDLIFDSKESFEEFLAEWENIFPDYLTNLKVYCEKNQHVRLFFQEFV